MKPVKLHLAVFAHLLFVLLLPLAAAAEAGPQIHFNQTFVDLGDVPVGKIVRHRFRFRNTGNALLKIQNRLFLGKFIQSRTLEGC